MHLHLNPEALQAAQWACGAAAWIVAWRTAYQLLHLRARRRRDALFEALARQAMASDRPITFGPEEFKRH